MKAFNGSLPGPVIRVRAGWRVRILYRNDSGGAGTIHWHGLILPNAMDGVEGITQPLVPDGGSFVYEFTAANAGTRWYHDHVSHGQINGLFGMFVIDDPSDEPADLDFPLAFGGARERRSSQRSAGRPHRCRRSRSRNSSSPTLPATCRTSTAAWTEALRPFRGNQLPTDRATISVAFLHDPPAAATVQVLMHMGGFTHGSGEIPLTRSADPKVLKASVPFTMGGPWVLVIRFEGERLELPLQVGGS